MGKASGALAGAGTGAAIGAVGGPIGAGAGAVIGGVAGYLASDDDKAATPYQANAKNFMYGGNMSGQGRRQVQQYSDQAAALRQGADHSQRRDANYFGAAGHADAAAYGANNAVANSVVNQNRAAQQQAYGRMQQGNNQLAAYANQAQGPSAAAAQLQAGANTSFAQQMAAARSGGNAGGGANALRGAAFQQAGIMGQANAQAAAARAQETQNYQQNKLAALGAAQQGYGAEGNMAVGMRASDLSAAGLQANTALQAGQLQANTSLGQGAQFLQNRGLNDQYSLGQGQLAQGQDQLEQNVYQQQLAATVNYENMASGNYNASQGFNQSAQNANTAGQYGMASAGIGAAGQQLSDSREKRDKVRAEGVADTLAALGYQQQGGQYGQDPTGKYQIESNASEFGPPRDTAPHGLGMRPATESQTARDRFAPYAAERSAPGAVARFPNAAGYQSDQVPTARFADTDVRGAQPYAYQYKDPNAPGAAPGQQIGPMAQDLEHTAAAGAVHDTPQGKMVDPGRLTMVNTSAIGEQQRRLDALEAQLAAYGLKKNTSSYGGADLDALDDSYARERAYR